MDLDKISVPELLQRAKVISKQTEVGVFCQNVIVVRLYLKIKLKLKRHPPKKYSCEKNKKAINEAFSD